ncbi:MAG: hypothetical protein IOD12_12555, partial [Silvanigrellales bacterium]|nr:hypothetical protein [Silvanigrellales bacterium]
MTTLDELFARLQEAALRKENETEAERSAGTPWESPAEATGALGRQARTQPPACRCGQSGGVFVEFLTGRRRFAVCPACNPRLTCKRCDGTGHGRQFNLLTQMEDVVPYGCPCVSLEKAVERLREAHIPDRYLGVDFSTLAFDHLPPA